MLDPGFVRDHPDQVRKSLNDRGGDAAALDAFLEADIERRRLLLEIEAHKQERNRATEEIARMKRDGEDAAGERPCVRAFFWAGSTCSPLTASRRVGRRGLSGSSML